MLQALHAVPEAHRCLPFVRLFYAQPSTHVWHDGEGNAHRIIQAEGGEQGDPLMPALFSLGQHSALQHTQQQLQAGERLYMPTWTTSTSSPPPTELKQHTTPLPTNCNSMRTSSSTRPKPGYGTKAAIVRPVWNTSHQRCGLGRENMTLLGTAPRDARVPNHTPSSHSRPT